MRNEDLLRITRVTFWVALAAALLAFFNFGVKVAGAAEAPSARYTFVTAPLLMTSGGAYGWATTDLAPMGSVLCVADLRDTDTMTCFVATGVEETVTFVRPVRVDIAAARALALQGRDS